MPAAPAGEADLRALGGRFAQAEASIGDEATNENPLSGDRSGEGLPAPPASRLEHPPHPAPTAESLKAAEAPHDLPIAALFHVRWCRDEGDRQGAAGAAERPHHRPPRGRHRPIEEFPPWAQGRVTDG